MYKRIIFCLILILTILNIYSAEYGGVTAAPYLNLGAGVKPCGMGEAYTAVVDNVDAGWWNPGALVRVTNPQFTFMHHSALGETSYEYLAFAEPAEQLGIDIWGTIGITAMLVRIQDIVQTKEEFIGGNYVYSENYKTDRGEEVYGAGGTLVGLSYSWQAAKMFSVGATIKMINQKVAIEEGWIPALDAGILAKTFLEGFDIGVVFQNISFMQLDGAPLPLNLKFGISYKLKRLFTSELDPKDNFTFALDGILPIVPANMPFRLHTGIEYGFNIADIIFSIRTGYRFNGNAQFISDLGALAGLTVGIGIRKNFEGVDASLDYAFIPYGILGNSHRMGITISVGEPTPTPTPVPVNPPKMVKLTPQSKKIVVTWSVENKEKLQGYNVYMSYKPGGKYYKLNKTPVNNYYLTVGPLKSGLRCYFVVTAVDKNGRESKYSSEISAVPR